VQHDRSRQNERADEEEHQRIGERREHVPGRRNSQNDGGSGTEQRGHGHWQRFRDPEHDHRGEDRAEAVSFGAQRFEWGEKDRDEHCRGEGEANSRPHAPGRRVGFRIDGNGQLNW
jgi:hypothetical protein